MPLALTTAARMRLAEQTRCLLDEHGVAYVAYEPGDATHYEWLFVAPPLTTPNRTGQSYAGEVTFYASDDYVVADALGGASMLVPAVVFAEHDALHYGYVESKMCRGEHYAVILTEFICMVADVDAATLDRMRSDFPHIFGYLSAE